MSCLVRPFLHCPVTARFALGLLLAAAVIGQNPRYALIGNGCPGSMAVSRLSLISPPAIGSLFQVDVTNLPANAAVMLTGFSRTSSPFGPLPLQLGPFSMPGCTAYVSPDALVLLSGTGNRAAFVLAIPANSVLVGVRFFQQALVIDPQAGNGAGAVTSDAADAVIGSPGGHPLCTPVANMIPIWPGSFMMGSMQGGSEEQPVHTVNITRPFWIGKYEVTQAEYQAVMNTNPSANQGASYPVDFLSWDNAMAYCAALTVRERAANRLPAGYQYRLPTEAEWEYCCRAGTITEYNVGTSLNCALANFNLCVGQTSVVGSYAANPWGLHDMHGNVWEYCLEWFGWSQPPMYPAGPVSDPGYYYSPPLYPLAHRCNLNLRGGYWIATDYFCRSACRDPRNEMNLAVGVGYYDGMVVGAGCRVVLAPILVP